MPLQQLAFEYALAAIEAARGVAEAAPSHRLNGTFSATPDDTEYVPPDASGMLEEAMRSDIVRRSLNWDFNGALDFKQLRSLWLPMGVGPQSAPATPTGATNARTIDFSPAMTADDLKTVDFWWGDPNVQIYRTAYASPASIAITSDANATSGIQLQASGTALPYIKVADPVLPSLALGPIVKGIEMQAWVDAGANPVGTTSVTSRLISATLTIPLNRQRIYTAKGPNSDLGFSDTALGKRRASLSLRFLVPDTAEWDQYQANTMLKVRVRLNGPLIEAGFNQYFQMDIHGAWRQPRWGEYEGVARTLEFSLQSHYLDAWGRGWKTAMQLDTADLV